MKTETKETVEAEVISINSGKSGLVDIIGKRQEGDEKFSQFIDLGEIDNNRTKGVNAAYGYLAGEKGKFSSDEKHSTKTVVAWSTFVFIAGVVSTFFALTL